jgi:hypothetical protein
MSKNDCSEHLLMSAFYFRTQIRATNQVHSFPTPRLAAPNGRLVEGTPLTQAGQRPVPEGGLLKPLGEVRNFPASCLGKPNKHTAGSFKPTAGRPGRSSRCHTPVEGQKRPIFTAKPVIGTGGQKRWLSRLGDTISLVQFGLHAHAARPESEARRAVTQTSTLTVWPREI